MPDQQPSGRWNVLVSFARLVHCLCQSIRVLPAISWVRSHRWIFLRQFGGVRIVSVVSVRMLAAGKADSQPETPLRAPDCNIPGRPASPQRLIPFLAASSA